MQVLIAAETWASHKIEIKGFASHTTSSYDVGLTEWVAALRAGGLEVDHIANHDAIVPNRIETPEGFNPTAIREHPVLARLAARWPYFLGYVDWLGRA